MRIQIGCLLVGLAIAVSATATALAQVGADPATTDDSSAADTTTSPAAVLFVRVLNPTGDDVEVPLTATTLAISGITLDNAVLSVDGDLVDVDEQGGFATVAELEEGANQIEIVASDGDGNQVTTTLFVVRGGA